MYDEKMAQKIIKYIRENKVSTTEVGDCLDKTGAIIGPYPLTEGHFEVGKIAYTYGHSNTNWPIHDQLRYVSEDRVIFVDSIDTHNRALFGELVATFIFDKLKARAVVSTGLMRDANELIRHRFPIWCTGITPEGCFNIPREETSEIAMIAKKNRDYYHDAIAVCDDCGVVVIPKERINEEMYQRLVNMKKQEKMWFYCVQKLGWDTFDTVCLKKYKELNITIDDENI
jgi:4-hydroxy-4-methyl-2-oxoglutarate aldolase